MRNSHALKTIRKLFDTIEALKDYASGEHSADEGNRRKTTSAIVRLLEGWCVDYAKEQGLVDLAMPAQADDIDEAILEMLHSRLK